VLECLEAGTSFRKLDNVEDDLKETDQLEMKREGKNEFEILLLLCGSGILRLAIYQKKRMKCLINRAGKQFYATIFAKERQLAKAGDKSYPERLTILLIYVRHYR